MVWLIAGLAGAGLLAWAAVTVFSPGGSRSRTVILNVSTPASSALPALAVHRPAEVRMALLFDCYEHGVEHAPPRDPSGVMQRRDRHYNPGPQPFTFLRSKLTGSAGDVPARRWLDAWEANWRRGGSADAGNLDELDRILPLTSLSPDSLLGAGLAFNFLDGDHHAARWYRAGLERASTECGGVQSGDPRVRRLLALMDQTKALWRLKDHAAMEKRFSLAMQLNPPLSPEARRAGYLHAEMLYYQNRFQEALGATLAVQAKHESAGDLGAMDQSDVREMKWLLGLMFFFGERYDAALPYLRGTAQTDKEHCKSALQLLIFALIRTDQLDEAEAAFRQVRDEVPQSVFAPAMAAELQARRQAKTRRAIGGGKVSPQLAGRRPTP